jgi:hypothetical protein
VDRQQPVINSVEIAALEDAYENDPVLAQAVNGLLVVHTSMLRFFERGWTEPDLKSFVTDSVQSGAAMIVTSLGRHEELRVTSNGPVLDDVDPVLKRLMAEVMTHPEIAAGVVAVHAGRRAGAGLDATFRLLRGIESGSVADAEIPAGFRTALRRRPSERFATLPLDEAWECIRYSRSDQDGFVDEPRISEHAKHIDAMMRRALHLLAIPELDTAERALLLLDEVGETALRLPLSLDRAGSLVLQRGDRASIETVNAALGMMGEQNNVFASRREGRASGSPHAFLPLIAANDQPALPSMEENPYVRLLTELQQVHGVLPDPQFGAGPTDPGLN